MISRFTGLPVGGPAASLSTVKVTPGFSFTCARMSFMTSIVFKSPRSLLSIKFTVILALCGSSDCPTAVGSFGSAAP